MPFIRIEGEDVYYKHALAGGQPKLTLVFVHGLGSSHAFYEPIVPDLVKEGLSCLSLDTPGSGLSKYKNQDKSPQEIATVVTTLISQLQLDYRNVIVVGHSMGAMVACEIAAKEPLRGVALIGPVHPTPALGDIFGARITAVKQNGLESLADAIPLAATGSKATATQQAFIRALILSQSDEGYVSLCRTIAEAQAPPYESIKCPLLVIAGSEDRTSPLSGCETIMSSWGNANVEKDLQIVEGVGHWHCIEAGDEVAGLIKTFAKRLVN